MLKIELFVGRQLIKVIRTRRLFLPKKIIFTSLALIFCASFFAFKYFTNPANAELAEINPADWHLETFFLDSEINEGRDPIQNLVWEPEEKDYNANQYESAYDVSKIITLQINYHNENVSRDYQPGELQISVPTPFPADDIEQAYVKIDEKMIGANTGNVTSYDWDCISGASNTATKFTFTNRTTIQSGENIEGSIQVTFKITSGLFRRIESIDNNQTRSFSSTIVATLNDTASSNSASFSFSRTIRYDWKRVSWDLYLHPSKISTYSGLGNNADQYTWVKWHFNVGVVNSPLDISTPYKKDYYGVSDYSFVEDLFADDVVILPIRNNNIDTAIEGIGNGEYSLDSGHSYGYFVTGYPKDTYNTELGTNIVSEKVTLSGTYLDSSTPETISVAEETVNLDDYQFDPQNGLTTLTKRMSTSNSAPLAQDLRSGSLKKDFTITASIHDSTGDPYDIILGDDVVFYKDTTTGDISRLSEEYYSFRSITQIYLYDDEQNFINCNDYDVSIYARIRGSNEYTKLEQTIRCRNASYGSGTYYFPNNTVAWYLEIKGMDKTIKQITIEGEHSFSFPTAPDYGDMYDFARFEVYKDGQLQNPKTKDDYPNNMFRELVAEYDQETYGAYQYRAAAWFSWICQKMPENIYRTYSPTLSGDTPVYQPDDDAFHGTLRFYVSMADYNKKDFDSIGNWVNIADQFDEKYLHTEAHMYALLPFGVELESTSEEIVQSFISESSGQYKIYRDHRAQSVFSSKEDYENYVRTHMAVSIITNWRNTGRTYIKVVIDFSERPFTVFNCANSRYSIYIKTLSTVYIKYRITYDSYRENGLNYKFIAAVDDDQAGKGLPEIEPSNSYLDTAVANYDNIEDFNDNGSTEDNIWRTTHTITLLPVASSHQNIQTSIYSADNNEYSLDDTIIEPGEEYTYKLRLRNSTNRITNTVIYSELEEAYEDNPHWNGDFQGVDTSFAESQLDNYGNPVQVKVYWSAKASVGKLSEDNSWQEYDETTTDKTQVKSLAFQYLDQNGDPAILPQSNYSYVLVKMKAPDDDSISTYAYNKCFSEWNPIDNLSGEIQPLLTGIESNVVRAYFSEEIEAHAKKVWDDQDNKYGLRPRSITFYLYDGDELINEGEIDVENLEDSLDFLNLDITKRANYRIEIDPIEGYDTSLDIDLDTLTFTFTSKIILPDEPEEETPSDESSDAPTTHDSVMFYVMFATVMSTAAFVAMLRQTRR